MSFKENVEAIRKTGLVHRNWYLETYPDVARLGMEPAEHYLKYGAAMGRNPGKDFNTKFYLDRYPDVAEAGLNPLLHYARFGKKEGRLAGSTLRSMNVRRLTDYLWSGPDPDAVIPELTTLMNDPKQSQAVQFEIARKLAVRKAFDGDLDAAEDLMDQVDTIAPNYANTRVRFIIHAFILMNAQKREVAQRMVQLCLEQPDAQDDPTATLALSNTYDSDVDRLALINAVYTREGLAPLRLRDSALPLNLSNIEGDAVPPCTIDHGLVSIIMPIFKAEDMIETAIRSLCQQSYRNIEIVAVDDCSPDSTFAVLEQLAAEDPRIRPVRQEVNAGAYPARNQGLDLAKGKFITTHDADDWSHPQKIETQIKALMAGNAQGVVAHWVRVRPSLHITPDWRISPNLIHWSHSTFLARRSMFDALGSWDNVRISGDTELIWRMQAAYGSLSLEKVMPRAPLALALNDDNSLTRTKQTHVSTIYYGLRRFYREIAQHWHRQPNGLSAENHAKRLEMIPDEMFRKPDGPVELDLVLRGDCSDPKAVFEMRDTLQDPAHAQHSVGIDHLPDITRLPGRFTPEFFDLLALPRVRPVIPGTEIIAAKEIHING